MRALDYRGDTIVEVIISLAVLALAFTISYATAQKSIVDIQNTQEHSFALETLDSQMQELIYYNNTSNVSSYANGQSFCMRVTSPSGIGKLTIPSGATPNNTKWPSGCTTQQIASFAYYYKITVTNIVPMNGNTLQQVFFKISIYWNGLGNLGNQTEVLYYKDYQAG